MPEAKQKFPLTDEQRVQITACADKMDDLKENDKFSEKEFIVKMQRCAKWNDPISTGQGQLLKRIHDQRVLCKPSERRARR